METEINNNAKKYINNIREKCERIKPLVAINCITYNHEKYLRDALDGFVMQQTYFPFVAIVHDDASTDGTAEIIREYAEKYPDIILPIYETENQYSKRNGALRQIMHEARNATGAKYIAYCEGDDYWTDSKKLQKQVDFLETNPDYSLVAHNCIELWVDGSKDAKPYRQLNDGDVSRSEIFKSAPFQTASLFLRSSVTNSEKYLRITKYKILGGDKWLMMCCSYFGKVYCFSDVMSVYRRHSAGMSFSNWNNHRLDSILERRYFGEEFGPEIREIANRSMTESLIYEMIMGFKTLNFQRVRNANRALKQFCNTTWLNNSRTAYRQISYFRPFKYFLPH